MSINGDDDDYDDSDDELPMLLELDSDEDDLSDDASESASESGDSETSSLSTLPSREDCCDLEGAGCTSKTCCCRVIETDGLKASLLDKLKVTLHEGSRDDMKTRVLQSIRDNRVFKIGVGQSDACASHTSASGRMMLCGLPVLKKCWCRLLGVTKHMFYSMLDVSGQGCLRPPIDGRTGGTNYEHEKLAQLQVEPYMMWLWCCVAEPLAEQLDNDLGAGLLRVQPESVPVLVNFQKDTLQHLLQDPVAELNKLPMRWLPRTSRQELYDNYTTWAEEGGRPCSSYSTFLRVWKGWHRKVLKMRDIRQHQRCEKCAELSAARKKVESREELREIVSRYYNHLQGQYADRAVYAKMMSLSEEAMRPRASGTGEPGVVSNHSSLICLFVDGMDQSKFRVPRNLCSNKLWDSLWRPTGHVLGVLSHGIGEHYFFEDADLPKDSSNNVECLARCLDYAQEEVKAKGLELPVHLAVWADNTCREQKNTTGILWLAYLVASGRFHSATQCHLQKGHTHSLIDQRFSIIGTKLFRTKVLEDPQAFVAAIKEALPEYEGGKL